MDVTGDQPNSSEWQDWPAMYGGATEIEEAMAGVKTSLSDEHRAEQAERNRMAAQAIGGPAPQDFYPALLNALKSEGDGRVPARLHPNQVLSLIRAESDLLCKVLNEKRFYMPTHRHDILNRLDEIRSLTLMLNDSLLPTG